MVRCVDGRAKYLRPTLNRLQTPIPHSHIECEVPRLWRQLIRRNVEDFPETRQIINFDLRHLTRTSTSSWPSENPTYRSRRKPLSHSPSSIAAPELGSASLPRRSAPRHSRDGSSSEPPHSAPGS